LHVIHSWQVVPLNRTEPNALIGSHGSNLLDRIGWTRHRYERIAGPHHDRLRNVHPATFTHGRRRHYSQPLAGARVNLEDFYLPPGLDAFEVKARNDPVVGEAEGEVWVVVERKHQSPHSSELASHAFPFSVIRIFWFRL
jgi:hypothetical protein